MRRTLPGDTLRPKGRCPGCMKPVYRRGIRHWGRVWHESCLRKS